jgi:hypothetical protein
MYPGLTIVQVEEPTTLRELMEKLRARSKASRSSAPTVCAGSYCPTGNLITSM